MYKIHVNLLKMGIILWIPVLMLTACTGKNDIVLELDAQEAAQEDQENAEISDIQEIPQDNADILEADDARQTEEHKDTEEGTVSSGIYVHICGAVVHPGVYMLAPGSRVFEAVAAAGGFREDACEDFINQAMPLQDGQRLSVPTQEEVRTAEEEGTYLEQWADGETTINGAAAGAGASVKDDNGLVNINTASEAELSEIPGIGAGKAAAIVTYRQENGAFASTEDIMKVSGIKEGTYEKIKDKITVN